MSVTRYRAIQARKTPERKKREAAAWRIAERLMHMHENAELAYRAALAGITYEKRRKK